MSAVGGLEDDRPVGVSLSRQAVVHVVGLEEADSRVVMLIMGRSA